MSAQGEKLRFSFTSRGSLVSECARSLALMGSLVSPVTRGLGRLLTPVPDGAGGAGDVAWVWLEFCCCEALQCPQGQTLLFAASPGSGALRPSVELPQTRGGD